MSFLRRVAGLSLRDRVRSFREELGVDPLLRVERSQMRWLGHLRMPPGRLPGEVLRASPTGAGKTQDTLESYARLEERLGIPQEELDRMAG